MAEKKNISRIIQGTRWFSEEDIYKRDVRKEDQHGVLEVFLGRESDAEGLEEVKYD